MEKITVGILGLGTVGVGVANLLKSNPQFRIKWAAVRDKAKPRETDLERFRLTHDPQEIINDPEVEILVEVAGGINPIYELVREAIVKGKHIVTANKELIAKHGAELFALAEKHNVIILFEAAVGGGIPLIATLHRGLAANRLTRVAGILNGTTNYILTSMERDGRSFSDALSEAQALGFAEANPTDDVEGYDVGYKISILALLAFGSPVDTGSIYRQGIDQITDQDIALAREFGFRIKMIGLAQRGENNALDVRAHPMLVSVHHPLATVDGVNNAIFITGDAVGEIMMLGPGAGQLPTASAVVGDIINLASALRLPEFAEYFRPTVDSHLTPLSPIEDASHSYYLRIETNDSPGVIGSLGLALGNHGVSLHSVIQKGATTNGGATIILLTHKVKERLLNRALREIEAQAATRRIGIILRVFDQSL